MRNCVVHSAGLLDSYQYREQLPESLNLLPGSTISSANFLGTSIEIGFGSLERLIDDLMDWMPRLDRRCYELGLLKPTPRLPVRTRG